MTLVGWSPYSEFEVNKSLSGDASSGIFQAVLKELGSADFSARVMAGRPIGRWWHNSQSMTDQPVREVSMRRDIRNRITKTGNDNSPR